MCTAISWNSGDHYFGRNLDLDRHFNEAVTVTPRNFPLSFRTLPPLQNHYAIIGIATVIESYPLYYDATNEFGLSMAALNFPGNAFYPDIQQQKDNIAPFEFIPWILGQCKNLAQVREKLKNLHLCNIPFSQDIPLTPLHWMISDPNSSIVIESTKTGSYIYDNPTDTLTNSPAFDYHYQNLSNYMHVTAEQATDRFSDALMLTPYSLGMGGLGLPGDLSSTSRFIRAVFTLKNASTYDTEEKSVAQFFHILNTVSQTDGCVHTPEGLEKTIYSSCCNTDKCIYYYTTYFGNQITAVSMTEENKNTDHLISYPLRRQNMILYESQQKTNSRQ